MFDQIGPIITDFVDLDFGKYDITNQFATGEIIYIDSFGNIITNIDGLKIRQFIDYGREITVIVGEKQLKLPFLKSYNFVKPGDILSTIGSSNLFEIALNQGNAAKKLNIKPNDEIKVLF